MLTEKIFVPAPNEGEVDQVKKVAVGIGGAALGKSLCVIVNHSNNIGYVRQEQEK
jgi:hypothetical protein